MQHLSPLKLISPLSSLPPNASIPRYIQKEVLFMPKNQCEFRTPIYPLSLQDSKTPPAAWSLLLQNKPLCYTNPGWCQSQRLIDTADAKTSQGIIFYCCKHVSFMWLELSPMPWNLPVPPMQVSTPGSSGYLRCTIRTTFLSVLCLVTDVQQWVGPEPPVHRSCFFSFIEVELIYNII